MKRLKRCVPVLAAAMLMTACGVPTYDGFVFPEQGGSHLTPAAEYTRSLTLSDTAPEEPTLKTASSADGICKIEKKEHFYYVTLDLEQGDHHAAGAAYAEAILAVFPGFAETTEPYLYENIKAAFSDLNEKSYTSLNDRVTALKNSLAEEYRQEIEGFAERISGGRHGFEPDGMISYEEALTFQMVPDALRGTACSAATLDGSRTVSGARLSARILEWIMGSENQIAKIQTVLRLKNGSHSVTLVSALGLLDVITGFNDSGVLAGDLDVGGTSGLPFTYEGRTCYTYTLRYALEQFTTAKEVGEYMVSQSDTFTYTHNIFLTDKNGAYCAEDSTAPLYGASNLRKVETPLRPDYQMQAKGAFFCVNCFVSDGMTDPAAYDSCNLIRWKRFNEWFGGDEKFTAGSFKSRLACETKENYDHQLNTVGADADAFHVLVIDYATGSVQVSFYRPDDLAGIPEYTQIAVI